MNTINVQVSKEITKIIQRFIESGFEIYIVGGAIRDILMGKIVYDWDFTTNATPEQILNMFPEGFYDNIYGTVGVKSEEEGARPYEITTFRTEHGYSDSRRPDKVSWGSSLKEDLQRRDFTINAMALKPTSRPDSFEIIDMYDGNTDLKEKKIRAVGDASERFSEDALRMMRAVRIASELGFNIEDKTFYAIKQNASLINKIAKERIKDELIKLLKSQNAAEGITIFRDTGLMQEVLPELEKTFGVDQKSPGRHHIYDVGTHSVLALKNCKSYDPIVRFATLIHDAGKPQTYKKLDSGTITFYNHEMVGAKIAERIAERLKFSNKEKVKLVTLVRWHQFSVDERQTDSAIRRFIKNVGTDSISDMLDLRTGDRLGGGAKETSWRLEEFKNRIVEVQKQPFSIKDLKINGVDIMKILNIPSGPKVGEVLSKLFKEVESNKLKNEKTDLIKKVEELSKN